MKRTFLMATVALAATMFGSGAMAQSGYGQAETHPADRETATRFGARVAETLVRWVKGK